MAGSLGISVTFQILKNELPGLDEAVIEASQAGVREAAREFLLAAEDRIDSQAIPGPPLTEQTIAIKRRRLQAMGLPTDRAGKKWLFEGRAIDHAEVVVQRLLRGAKAEIIPPSEGDRPRRIYQLLELGGVNESGNVIQPRPLLTTVARQDLKRILDRFSEVTGHALARRLE